MPQMQKAYTARIAATENIPTPQVKATTDLLAEGATVPFIARYRKEATGGLDEVAIIAIRDRLEQLEALDKRRETILKSMGDQGVLSEELNKKILAAETLSTLEDIYLPFKPKRRTRGMIAKERGLEPLAAAIFAQEQIDPAAEAAKFVDAEKEVPDADVALAGARDIIAEWISEDADTRAELRELYAERGVLNSRVLKNKEEEGAKYKDYFEWEEPIAKAPSHRILAIRRGSKEGFLAFSIQPEPAAALGILRRKFVRADNQAAEQVAQAANDSYNRLLSLSMETEMRLDSRKRADEEAIRVFTENLRELLLASPLGQKTVLALDPGFRTGSKVVCLDRQGKLLCNDTIYPLEPQRQTQAAGATIMALVEKYNIEAIAIGNGTGGRETQAFCQSLKIPNITIVMVNESGASVYSASQAARDEFPDYDLTVRGSVSIGRRLMDPLAELVKLDPKSIGVGQYQHDVDQKALKTSLDDTVESCVNAVGVEINTASKQLLSYVSGLSERVAGNIVSLRDEKGPFRSRKEILKAPGMGAKTFEQAAGFLRIREGDNPLDSSAVHPESYPIVEQMAGDIGCTVSDLIRDPQLRAKIDLTKYVSDTVGMPTLEDIMAELAKPGRDPRKQFEAFNFAENVNKVSDLQPGMKLPGIVTNVAAFGAFVDVGVHQDGLVHISQLADKFVSNPADVVKVQQKVMVTVMEIDLDRQRIALSMRSDPEAVRPKGGERSGKSKPSVRPNKGPKQVKQSQQQSRQSDLSNNPFGDFFNNHKVDRK